MQMAHCPVSWLRPQRFAGAALLALFFHQDCALAASSPATDSSKRHDHTVMTLEPAMLDLLSGYYRLDSYTAAFVSRTGSRLLLRLTRGPGKDIFPEMPTRFLISGTDDHIDFLIGADGVATTLVLRQAERVRRAARISEAEAKEIELRSCHPALPSRALRSGLLIEMKRQPCWNKTHD